MKCEFRHMGRQGLRQQEDAMTRILSSSLNDVAESRLLDQLVRAPSAAVIQVVRSVNSGSPAGRLLAEIHQRLENVLRGLPCGLAEQAIQLLERLESGIQKQYQLRLRQADSLPPERRMVALFEAQARRDRQLVTAYRQVMGRLTHPEPPDSNAGI